MTSILTPSRRGLIKGLASLFVAPAIVPYSSLMPVKKVVAAERMLDYGASAPIEPIGPRIGELWYDQANHQLRMWTGQLWEIPYGKCMVSSDVAAPYVDENFRPGTITNYGGVLLSSGTDDPYGTDYVSERGDWSHKDLARWTYDHCD